MERPTYLRRLVRQKWLLIIGGVVAVAAGLLAGFTIDDGQIESRVEQTYAASSTIMLTSNNPRLFQTEIPGTTQALPDPAETPAAQELIVTEATPMNLSDSAILLAYLASSDAIVDAVATAVGGLEDGDAVTAVRRTTQPAGDEQFGGRLSLPIIDIVGVSTSADRAELIAAEATNAFGELVVAEQTEWGVPEEIRLVLDEINAPVAGEGEGSNPAIPVIVTAVGVFLLFIALALLIEAVRDARRRRGEEPTAASEAAQDEPAAPEATPVGSEVPSDEASELVEAAPRARRRRSSTPIDTDLSQLLTRDSEPADSPRS